MTDIIIDAGTLTANRETRTVTGLLVPYGETCRSNLGSFAVDTGAFSIPTDLTGMSLNVEHSREKVVGAPISLAETDSGIVATFSLARTPAGDAALLGIEAGTRKHLSVEASNVKIKDGKAVGGTVFAAALVAEPAFPSATLLAAAADTPDDPTTTTAHEEETFTDENGVTWTRVVDTEVESEGNKTTTTTTVVEETEEPEEAPAEPEGDPAVGTATAPNTLTATRAASPVEALGPDLHAVTAAIARFKAGERTGEAATLLAALSDIKISGSGALPAAGVLQPNWLGKLYQGIPYVRQFITLHQLGTDISAAGKSGFKMGRNTSGSPQKHFDGTWAGNKAAINSVVGFTSTAASTLARYAIGEDVAREFYDLPGGQEVIEAFIAYLIEDYYYWSDQLALTAIKANATTIAAGTYPSQYTAAMGQLIQGILAVKAEKADGRRDVPTYAIANQKAYEQLLYTPKDLVPEFVKFGVTTDGSAEADSGTVQVVLGDTGIANTPSVIVGAKNAIEFDELAGGPLTVDALDIARGGVDKAVHGYVQTFIVRPEALVRIGTADA